MVCGLAINRGAIRSHIYSYKGAWFQASGKMAMQLESRRRLHAHLDRAIHLRPPLKSTSSSSVYQIAPSAATYILAVTLIGVHSIKHGGAVYFAPIA
jgi:hypothetical protein